MKNPNNNKVQISNELFLTSLIPTIKAMNNISNCNYFVNYDNALYHKATIENDVDGVITDFESIEWFAVDKESVTLFIRNGNIKLTKDGMIKEED